MSSRAKKIVLLACKELRGDERFEVYRKSEKDPWEMSPNSKLNNLEPNISPGKFATSLEVYLYIGTKK